MIYASGVVTMLATNENAKVFKNFKNKTVTLKFIDEVLSTDHEDTAKKIRCEFTAILPRSYECRSLEDYTGKIKPFLQSSIKNVIVTVQISHLNYLSRQAIDALNKR